MGKMMSSEKKSNGVVNAIVVGAGQRGYGYAHYVKEAPEDFQVIAVAEPRQFHRERIQKLCFIPDERAYDDWRHIIEKEKFADCVIICTQDKQHKAPAIAFAKKGYHVLLEKPMAVTEEDCREIVAECKKNNVLLTVCHVLRYTPWVRKLKELIDKGGIGEIVNIQHLEPIGYWHFAHSYVRGNWHKEADSAPSLLAKCCHDLDLVKYWMGSKACHSVSSFGHLSHFNKNSKPPKAASRCLDCPYEVESACPYSARKIYMDCIKSGHRGWPVSVIAETPDIESVTEALRTGPYGRCVYDMDNDVMSQQTVNMQFTGGATATMSMVAFTKDLCNRKVRIFGTKGELTYEDGCGAEIKHCDFTTGQTYSHKLEERHEGALSGHGGADYYMIKSFVDALKNGDFSKIVTGADDTLASHLLVFAAEKARKENRVVTITPDHKIQ